MIPRSNSNTSLSVLVWIWNVPWRHMCWRLPFQLMMQLRGDRVMKALNPSVGTLISSQIMGFQEGRPGWRNSQCAFGGPCCAQLLLLDLPCFGQGEQICSFKCCPLSPPAWLLVHSIGLWGHGLRPETESPQAFPALSWCPSLAYSRAVTNTVVPQSLCSS